MTAGSVPSSVPVAIPVAILVAVLALAACTGSGTPASDPTSSPVTRAPSPTATSGTGDGPGPCMPLHDLPGGEVASGPATDAAFPWDRPDPVVADAFDLEELLPGGPPPDGILPIDMPCFDDLATADAWLEPQSPVMVLEVGGDTRVYPLAILTQHEIVNDVVGTIPVTITYCPLCNSALAFERTVDGAVLDFGTSGRLYRSNLVMYDRQTRSLWTQFDGEAVVGAAMVGTTLERLPTSLLSWADVVDVAPDALVLSRASVPGRDYGRNPYPGYEGNGDTFLFRGPRDDRIGPNTRVVGLGDDDDAVAVTLPHLRDLQVVATEVGGDPVTVWWAPGQASALDGPTVDEGQDVGSAVAFDPRIDGAVAAFTATGDATFHDRGTGSTFDLSGTAVDGPLAGTALEPVAHDDTFWFVWFAFRPATRLVPEAN